MTHYSTPYWDLVIMIEKVQLCFFSVPLHDQMILETFLPWLGVFIFFFAAFSKLPRRPLLADFYISDDPFEVPAEIST